MKPHGDYHPPEGWIKFETLKPGAKFHDVQGPGNPTQFIKLQSETGTYAANLDNGLPVNFDLDEFVYPIDAGWIGEFGCYGFKKDELEQKMTEGGHRAVLAHVFTECDARKESWRWREELTKYVPELSYQSFAGVERVVKFFVERLKAAAKDA